MISPLLAVLTLGSPALAAEDRGELLRLTWIAPNECPSTEAVRAAVLRDVDGTSTRGAVLEAEAQVAPAASGWSVRLRTRRGASRGEREIRASTCEGLAEATAVVLGLALSSSAPAPDAPRRIETEDGRSRHALAIGASMAVDGAALPSAAVGGSLSVAWTPGRFRVELDARRWASQSGSVGGAGPGARFGMTTLGGRGCWRAAVLDSLDLGPCGGADAHLVSAPGFGADTNYAADAAWTTLAAGGLGRLALTPWLALRSRVEALVPLTRPRFVVENEGAIHRPAAIGASVSIGLETHFL